MATIKSFKENLNLDKLKITEMREYVELPQLAKFFPDGYLTEGGELKHYLEWPRGGKAGSGSECYKLKFVIKVDLMNINSFICNHNYFFKIRNYTKPIGIKLTPISNWRKEDRKVNPGAF